MKLKTKAINLKPYKDPDEFIKNLGGEEFQKRIDEAENAFLYVVEDLYNNTNMEDPDESSYFKNFIIEELVDFDTAGEKRMFASFATFGTRAVPSAV